VGFLLRSYVVVFATAIVRFFEIPENGKDETMRRERAHGFEILMEKAFDARCFLQI
jgi:hypothetical protein